jgi:hypothetical protein
VQVGQKRHHILPMDAVVLRRVVDRSQGPGLDVVRVQEVGLMGATCPDALEEAACEGRQLVPRDRKTKTAHAYARVAGGLPLPGVFVIPDRMAVGQAATERETLEAHRERERNRTEYNTGHSLTEGIDPMTTPDFEPLTLRVPLREESSGVIRVGTSRVLLELVIRAFKAGATPEAIVQSYDTLNLADVYAVLSRYLADPAPFEDYLRQCDEAAAQTRRKIEESQGPQGDLRAILLARAKAREERRVQTGS